MSRIRELREDADLRQSDVSAAVGIDQRTLSNYETGKTNPDSFAVVRMADFFHVSADYLLGRVPDADTAQLIQRLQSLETELAAIRRILEKGLDKPDRR